ncbi:hypothetical protein [Bacilliculturomica massiliensis]|uniref:hypothetical protein n=1 Tax=Bacilliculturomica massiliensis TaxID=1917867 RepID=UPI00102F51BA|nr:hypothetical protein [Bacilliculturomica massiliensis]
MHTKKLVAPVIITVAVVLYLFVFLIACLLIDLPLIAKLLGALIPSAFIGVAIYVLVERINEVRSGEEDDLSNY